MRHRAAGKWEASVCPKFCRTSAVLSRRARFRYFAIQSPATPATARQGWSAAGEHEIVVGLFGALLLVPTSWSAASIFDDLLGTATAMDRVTLPGTELETSRIGLGTASIHHLRNERARHRLLGKALDVGITHFDTARMYGDGLSERTLGRFLEGNRQKVTLATKFGIPASPVLEALPVLIRPHRVLRRVASRFALATGTRDPYRLSIDRVEDSLRRSMASLRTDWLDIAFVHEPALPDIEMILRLTETLRRYRESGRIRYLGLAGSAENCQAVLEATGDFFDLLQVGDSIENREADAVRTGHRDLQITFGYMRAALNAGSIRAPTDIMRDALARNSTGTVLVSTRSLSRLSELASVFAAPRTGL